MLSALERTTDSTGDAFYGQRELMLRRTETCPFSQDKLRNEIGLETVECNMSELGKNRSNPFPPLRRR